VIGDAKYILRSSVNLAAFFSLLQLNHMV
jgi:hypothetical protein